MLPKWTFFHILAHCVCEKNLVIDKYHLTFFVHQEIPCPMNWQLFPIVELSEDSSSKASFSDVCLEHDSRGVENSRRISKQRRGIDLKAARKNPTEKEALDIRGGLYYY